jgi:hypothetical protein
VHPPDRSEKEEYITADRALEGVEKYLENGGRCLKDAGNVR